MPDHDSASPPGDMKPLAWNGVRLQVPRGWDPVRLGKTYLYLEDDAGPVMELKWRRLQGRFSPDAALKKIAGKSDILIANEEKNTVPASWRNSLSGTDWRAFSWKGEGVSGQGVVRLCRDCNTAAVIQFFHLGRERMDVDRDVQTAVLASFRDHGKRASRRFEIYDVKAVVPNAYNLKTFSFLPGRFELEFERRRERLALARFAPADILLRGMGLEGWTRAAFALERSGDRVELLELDGHETAAFASGGVKDGFVASALRVLCLLSGRQRFVRGIARHDAAANKLLTVSASGTRPMDMETLGELGRNYGVV